MKEGIYVILLCFKGCSARTRRRGHPLSIIYPVEYSSVKISRPRKGTTDFSIFHAHDNFYERCVNSASSFDAKIKNFGKFEGSV